MICDVSVIVCNYNHDMFLGRCLRSLLKQKTFDLFNFEVILIDDGSTDNSHVEIQKFAHDKRLKFFKNDLNVGLPRSINRALDAAQGMYFVRVDSDDFVKETFLFFLKTYLDLNPSVVGVGCDLLLTDESSAKVARISRHDENIACGLMYRHEVTYRVGQYDESFAFREGHEFFNRAKSVGQVDFLKLPLYYYFRHAQARTIVEKEVVQTFDERLKGVLGDADCRDWS